MDVGTPLAPQTSFHSHSRSVPCRAAPPVRAPSSVIAYDRVCLSPALLCVSLFCCFGLPALHLLISHYIHLAWTASISACGPHAYACAPELIASEPAQARPGHLKRHADIASIPPSPHHHHHYHHHRTLLLASACHCCSFSLL
ncbi:uncharacterized protein MYCFIDRAFT_178036 [Pseudocercospora fijiensis CIRAD86]|uniref:Uncharacterized protein n=1 Tax=Pseudocercospora fijiensis (strain CIRAD86) TaxID=383855 RepID=M2YNX4_PSEFD|nr:uncharacterized protein MYCFIDRAFT_178036 [Pseudocercospora fijiensis CIRAD86]EME79450.1 hypothetical protein MYCFIDRAFT_178036 [Pseudocercospora fijiensis CIRAD86]